MSIATLEASIPRPSPLPRDPAAWRGRHAGQTGGTVSERTLDRRSMPPGAAGKFAPAALTRTHAFVADVSGPVMAISRATGDIEWGHSERRRRSFGDVPIAAAGQLFLVDLDGHLECFQAAT